MATYAAAGPGDVAGAMARPGTALAVVALAGGAVLLARTTVAAWRATGRWSVRAVIVASTVVALVLPGIPTAVAAAALLPPRGLDRGPAPAGRGPAGEEVSFTTSDGVRLAAWWAPGTNGAAVVVVPGTFGTRSAVLDEAVVLARHGYGVLLLDPRGNGASEGPGQGLGWFLERDLAAAVSFVLGRPQVRGGRVAVLGESLGGEGAIGAAAADPRIRAVVAEGVTGRTSADDAVAPAAGPLRPVVRAGHAVADRLVALLSPAPRPQPLLAAAVRSRCPLLLVAAGTQDAEVRTAERVARATAGRVVVDVVPGAPHAGGLETDPARWEATVADFLDRTLAPLSRQAGTAAVLADRRDLSQTGGMEWGRPSVEEQIRAAQARGEFDDLPGKGKPLRLSDVNDPDWWVKAYLRRENIDTSALVHPTVALRREADAFPGSLADLTSPEQVRAVLVDYNARVVAEWRRPAVGPTIPVAARQVDVDAMVARWRTLREERAATERERRAATGEQEPTDAAAHRPSWWRRLLDRVRA